MSEKNEKKEEKKHWKPKMAEQIEKEKDEVKESKPVSKQMKPSDEIKAEITGFATLTYKGRKFNRGDKVFFEPNDYKKFEKWLKKV